MVAATKKEAWEGERHLSLMVVGGKEDNEFTRTLPLQIRPHSSMCGAIPLDWG